MIWFILGILVGNLWWVVLLFQEWYKWEYRKDTW